MVGLAVERLSVPNKLWYIQKSSQQLTADVIKKLWNITWDMWEHWNGALHLPDIARQNIIEIQVNDQI